jgi:hypothetical protein
VLKVIGAGFGRTGTTSLKAALESIGFGPCYHMFEVFEHPEHVPFWDRAARGEAVDFTGLFADWAATVDWPACNFYRELMALYPEAKVLLSVRDPERWYQSCRNTIYPSSTRDVGKSGEPNEPIDPEEASNRARRAMITRLIWHNVFDDRFEDKDFAIARVNQHVAEVKRVVPADRLLVFDVKEGWGPLCRFLNVPVPEDRPFPHLNDTASFLGRVPDFPQPEPS